MKESKTISRIICLLLLCVLFTGLFSGCAKNPTANTIYTTSGYSDPISQLFPGYETAEHDKAMPDLLHSGQIIEAYDAQAENSAAEYWIPLTLETVVIAIDRDQTDMTITSWSDLRGSGAPISVLNNAPYNRLMAAAICYGLNGKNFSLNAAIGLLEPLYQNGKLKFDDPTVPVQICFDSEAAARIKNGENIEIIIPSEGTLSYIKGLLSDKPLTLPDNVGQILFESGLRLIDGSCDETIYPTSGQYAPAKISEDYNHLNTITQDWRRVMWREVRHSRLYTSADGREGILFPAVFIIITAIWVGSIMRRSQQKNIRQVILFAAFLLVGWMLTRVLKYQIDDETLFGRYLWYGYYIFQTLLPLGLLRIAALIGTGSENKRVPRWFWSVCSIDLALIGLVMTNDLHGMVFKMDLSQPGWSATGNYSYGILYYILTAVLLTQIIGGLIIMFTKIKHSPRRFGVIFPLIFTAVLITYIAGYALNIPLFAESDLTLVICSFALLFLELCIRAGQIPVNAGYRELFKNAELKLQVTDGGGKSIFTTNNAEPITSDQWSVISGQNVAQIDENTLILKNKISGGYAVWQENIVFINTIKTEIEAANALLSSEAESKEQAARNKARLELVSTVETDLADYEQRLAGLLDVPTDSPEYAENLKRAAIITCYIKRRAYFLYMLLEGQKITSFNEFVVFIDELAELVRLAGISCLTYCNLMGEISLDYVRLLYGFWGSLLEWAVTNREPEIILQTMSENDRLTMRVMAGSNAVNYELPENATQKMHSLGGTLEKTEDKEIGFTVLRLSLPAQGFPAAQNRSAEGGGRDA